MFMDKQNTYSNISPSRVTFWRFILEAHFWHQLGRVMSFSMCSNCIKLIQIVISSQWPNFQSYTIDERNVYAHCIWWYDIMHTHWITRFSHITYRSRYIIIIIIIIITIIFAIQVPSFQPSLWKTSHLDLRCGAFPTWTGRGRSATLQALRTSGPGPTFGRNPRCI